MGGPCTPAFFAPFADIQTPADRAFALASVKAAGDLGRELADLAALMFGPVPSSLLLALFADSLAQSLPDLFPDWRGMPGEDRAYLVRVAAMVFDRRLALHAASPAQHVGVGIDRRSGREHRGGAAVIAPAQIVRALSTGNGSGTYYRTARGRPASCCASPPPKRSAPRHLLGRAAVRVMEGENAPYWDALFQRFSTAAADLERQHRTGAEKGEASRRLWQAISAIFEEMEIHTGSGLPATYLPLQLVRFLHGTTGYLAVGTIPGPIADTKRPGKPAIGPMEARHIAFAVAYIRLCRAGKISDPQHMATIGRWYAVDRRTADGWSRRELTRFVGWKMSDPEAIAWEAENAGLEYQLMQHQRRLGKDKRR